MIAPETESDLAEAVANAAQPLRIQGGGTRPIGTPVAADVLSVAGLSGVTLYEPGALTLVARAGTPLREIEATLASENQRLAFEPMDHRPLLGTAGDPTIGGVVAGNISGPRRVQAGACRDHLLGVRFVDGTGAVLKNGGRVMKNVTGYDLVKLLAGSWGTLGVLSEVSLKVLPRPQHEATLIVHGRDAASGVAAMASALGSPFEVSGAAHIPLSAGDSADTMLRVEGFEASVAYRIGALKKRLAQFGDLNVVEGPASAKAWTAVRGVDMFADSLGDVWRLSVKPGDAPGLLDRSAAEGAMLDWGGGLIWLQVAEGTDLRARLGAFSGHATLIRASQTTRAALPVFQPEPAPLAMISNGLRKKFDPRGILNPGLMG